MPGTDGGQSVNMSRNNYHEHLHMRHRTLVLEIRIGRPRSLTSRGRQFLCASRQKDSLVSCRLWAAQGVESEVEIKMPSPLLLGIACPGRKTTVQATRVCYYETQGLDGLDGLEKRSGEQVRHRDLIMHGLIQISQPKF